MKVRTKPVKGVSPAKTAEILLEIIESSARIILSRRLNDCDDVDNIWSASVTLVLRLCALRLAHGNEEWDALLRRSAAFVGCSELNSDVPNAIIELDDAGYRTVLSSLDHVIASLKFDRLEQTLSMVYEMVLNMVPALVADVKGANTLKLKQIEKAKKRSGSFYSPSHLVEQTVEMALTPLVFENMETRALKPLSAILELKILDPAMGAGVFLIHAYHYLTNTFPESTSEEKLQIARQCLYGVDLDPLAVEVARLSLWLTVNEQMLDPVNDLDPVRGFSNLRVGNSLIGGRIDQCPSQLHQKWHEPRERNEQHTSIKEQLDLWCAKWFIPQNSHGEEDSLDEEQLIAVAKGSKFFHWEIEFPDVFDRSVRKNPGFDAVIGNPPWEISKPNSREFFGMVDPNYWALGKQDALAVQQRLLASDPELVSAWNSLQHRHRLFGRWVKNAPVQLDETVHAFAYQGSGDLNLYKLFCEQSFYLARDGGSIALIVPAGLYSDSGARDLRRLLFEKTNWSHLSSFDNSDGAFNIHRSFKYCVFLATKAGKTTQLKTSFRGQPCEYSAAKIAGLSPKWSVVSEVESEEALSLLERIYHNSQLLGNTEYGGSRIEYAREFDMTIDSRKFQQRDKLESKQYIQDAYGNWLSGKWRPRRNSQIAASDVIESACRSSIIAIEDVLDVYLPLYEGRMVGQFNANDKHWVRGKGRRAVWEPRPGASLGPQYLIHKDALLEREERHELKVGFLAVGCATNARTMIASCLSAVACGNSVPTLRLKTPSVDLYSELENDQFATIESDHGHACREMVLSETAHDTLSSDELQLVLSGCLNSFVFDFVIRRKMAGNNLNFFVIEECPLPKLTNSNLPVFRQIANLVAQLNFGHLRYSRELHRLGYARVPSSSSCSGHQRIVRSYIDVLVAHLYGLNHQDLSTILSDEMLSSGKLNTKGFFRVDRNLRAEDRLPSLVLKRSAELEAIGIRSMIERIETVVTLGQMSDSDITCGDTSIHARVLDEILRLSRVG